MLRAQTCELWFFLTQFTLQTVDFNVESETTNDFFFNNDEWAVIEVRDTPMTFRANLYNRTDRGWRKMSNLSKSSSGDRVGFYVTVQMRRHDAYYIQNLIVPVFINSAVGFFGSPSQRIYTTLLNVVYCTVPQVQYSTFSHSATQL